MFCKKHVSKTSHENICAGVQRAGTDVSLLSLGNFQEHLFCKHLWTNTCVKQVRICSQRNSGDGVLWSAVAGMMSLKFYLKRTQAQVFPCKICEVVQNFSSRKRLYQRPSSNKFVGSRPATFLNKGLLYMYFPRNF